MLDHQGPIKVNEDEIRNMPRKNTSHHKIEKRKKSIAREHKGESGKCFQQKAPQPQEPSWSSC